VKSPAILGQDALEAPTALGAGSTQKYHLRRNAYQASYVRPERSSHAGGVEEPAARSVARPTLTVIEGGKHASSNVENRIDNVASAQVI